MSSSAAQSLQSTSICQAYDVSYGHNNHIYRLCGSFFRQYATEPQCYISGGGGVVESGELWFGMCGMLCKEVLGEEASSDMNAKTSIYASLSGLDGH